ncbi:dual 3',5'-cyclic-AMP and -GMP phosphodiesterase 11-like isoform X2 [Ptychodera flava]|uniref:dual 3',5'-cyclic-AMP and -GMP phosphodiesterase 11-like isoform X2 n=1 Tax=Ptychodera flava TaxID=63121 RepID=UPI003969FA15
MSTMASASQTEAQAVAAANDDRSSSLTEEDRREFARIEQWLDEHAQFTHDYFARKATRSMIDGWFIARAVSSQVYETASGPRNSTPTSSGSRHSSGANTPVRKVSASEFEGRGNLGPMIQTVDGAQTFLREKPPSPTSRTRRTISELQQLDDREALFELVKDISNDLDLTRLCHKILQNVSILVKADRCSLFLVHGEKGSDDCYLASKLFDVRSDSTVEESLQEEIRIPWGKGIVGYVAKTGETVNIADAYEDPRFNCEIDLRTGYKTRNILCMPVNDLGGKVIGVAQVINKIIDKEKEETSFTSSDVKVFNQYLQFAGIGIRNAQLYEKSQLEIKRNQVLLDLATVVFEEQSTLANVVHRIMMHTVSLLKCERCSVLLVDDSSKGIFSQVFEMAYSDLDNEEDFNKLSNEESPRFPINIGITGYVATTGETLNIPDAHKDSKFDPKVDSDAGFQTRQILCMPIKNSSGAIVGVSQLVNKLDGMPFNQNDENFFEAFAIFCGMGMHNAILYEKACKAAARHKIALETLSYHATAPREEAIRLKKMVVPSASAFQLYSYSFSDFELEEDQTLQASIRMFLDLDLVQKFRINYEVICRWVLSVRKNYRSVTYHNWRHAFTVAQTMFAMLRTGQMHNVFGDLEALALLIACLCHDLDHRGTNNSFEILVGSPLAQLYSSSTMEQHHFDQCIMILNSKGNEILANLTQDQYSYVIRLLEQTILATDLAVYFRTRGDFFKAVDAGQFNWSNDEHRDLLRCMMMTACDISAIAKPWEVEKQVAEQIADEFFQQGDIERRKFNKTPSDMMNREKKDLLPKMQVEFIDAICLPVYKALTSINDKFKPLLRGCVSNREKWQELAEETETRLRRKECTETEEKEIDESTCQESARKRERRNGRQEGSNT